MQHLAVIQSEFLKKARKWEDLTVDEQRAYLQRHPGSRRRLNAQPSQAQMTPEQPVVPEQPAEKLPETSQVVPTVSEQKSVETIPAKSLSRSQIRKMLENIWGTENGINYSPKKGGFVFKRLYFYRHGASPEKLANSVVNRTKAIGLTPVVVDTSDNFHAWPKDSWFEAVVKFEQQAD